MTEEEAAAAVRQLAEASDIATMVPVLQEAMALREAVRQQQLGVAAENRCVLVLALAERKIGLELKRGRAEGWLVKHGPRRPGLPTIVQLGLNKQQNRECVDMAPVPEEIIRQTIAEATAADLLANRTEIKRRAGVPYHKGRKKAAEPVLPARFRPRLVHDSDDKLVIQMLHLLRNVSDLAKEIEPETLFRKTPKDLRHNFDQTLHRAAQFMAGLHGAWLWEKMEQERNAASAPPAASA